MKKFLLSLLIFSTFSLFSSQGPLQPTIIFTELERRLTEKEWLAFTKESGRAALASAGMTLMLTGLAIDDYRAGEWVQCGIESFTACYFGYKACRKSVCYLGARNALKEKFGKDA